MNEPIPNVAKTPLDLSAIAAESTPAPTLSLADANAMFSFVHCCDCGAGGHTGITLYTVIKDVTTGREAKACALHVVNYIRPKDLKDSKRRS